ncbi:multidrug and toxin extrusion protein 2-like [Leucoraja erinacea]|uniref:multidrug and toxin extrusion protein 2-like n=1 Tax=Leucoraja erinaceus TaxID=7782 RepID=UPI0024540AC4|nr:multidrug and toxin extrusion protein 2-like [Leucoraja erinacea]
MAAGIRVGMALGAGRPQQAKTSAMTALACTGCVALVLMTSLLLLKDVIAKIFTSNRQIIELVSSTIPVIAPFHLCDAIGSGAASGIVRGIGMQKVGAIANLMAFYIVGIPVGIALMFAAKIGILGLWAGLAISTFLLSAFFLTLIFRMDWGAAAQEASKRWFSPLRPVLSSRTLVMGQAPVTGREGWGTDGTEDKFGIYRGNRGAPACIRSTRCYVRRRAQTTCHRAVWCAATHGDTLNLSQSHEATGHVEGSALLTSGSSCPSEGILTPGQLIVRRGLVVLGGLLVLAVGVAVHFTIEL